MAKGALIILIIALSNILIALSQRIPNASRDRIFKIDTNKKEQKISTDVNKDFYLKFDSIPGTGYNWFLTYNSDEENLQTFDLVKDKSSKIFETSKNQPMLVGNPGFYYFKFRPLKKGKYTVEFIYKQAWEPKDNDPEVKVDILVD